ncbi:hypothetical protein ASZ90_005623 [hydrocarbon metagenome]|uniref:OmpA-like domain-containing protein n=1 Tax=hydrocarbon metagenome TaxID=938273 RepID=A0A0W8FUL7_9ZZZZ
MKKCFVLASVLMVIFYVTAVQAETNTGTTAAAKQWWEDGYVPPPRAEAPVTEEVAPPTDETTAAPAEVTAPQAEVPVATVEVAAPKEEKPVTEKVSIPLNVKFDTAKSDIKNKYDKDIKKVADFMKANPGAKAIIEGHTDNVDKFNNPDNNMKLSQARADSVRQYLIDKFGIDASSVTAIGYGSTKPIAGNDTAEGRNKNRRVQAVIEVLKKK